MRTSRYLLSTLKEMPSDAEIISHQLMLRAGMIRKLTSGLYTWLPSGLRVLRKVENIIRDEMNKAGSIEISMPIVQPADLWKESGRLEKSGSELLRFFDHRNRLFILGPTHEEVSTVIARNELNSYKQLPLSFFQIQTKFRDEIRPRFGVIRSREFLMKDAYSFHISQESLQETYDIMYTTYSKIFTRIGLNFQVEQADTGFIGGKSSHEFQVLVQNKKDNVNSSSFMESSEKNEFSRISNSSIHRLEETETMKLIDTSHLKTISELIKYFNLPIEKVVKTLLVKSRKGSVYPFVALLIRGDHKLNKKKVEKLSQVASPLTLATELEIRSIINVSPSFLGPINLPIPIIMDSAVADMRNFVAGANVDGKHFFGINWKRDISIPNIEDIRDIEVRNKNLDNGKRSVTKHSIEVGHIFQLGTEYSHAMNASVQDKDGRNQILMMGCYGIGITRVVAASVEQNHDTYGIVWSDNIAPFQVAILPINMHRSYRVQKLAERLYTELIEQSIDVLIDDRQENPGTMFSDMDLIGIPHIIIVGNQNIDNNDIEYRYRRDGKKKILKISEIVDFLVRIIKG